jgi:hypothetical protein
MEAWTASFVSLLVLLAWGLVWSLGGTWLARQAFRLQSSEEAVVGIAVGFILQNWLVNWLARGVPLPWVSWLAAVLVLAAGLAAATRRSGLRGLAFSVRFWPLALLVVGSGVFFMISRGMAIFDDFAHLPTVSIMATGDIPPHFSFDPGVLYGYHHFLLLFSAQTMRVADVSPWVGIDIGRAFSFGMAVVLAGLWTQRLTRSRLAGLLGGAMMAFGSGSRWLLLFIPHKLVLWLGSGLQMIGSGAASGPTLAEAITNPWAAEGTGPMPFPFAFANGIFPPGVISAHTANGMVPFVVILLLLLTFSCWRKDTSLWLAASLSAVIFSTWGLLTEAELVLFLGGWGLVALGYALQHRTLRLPDALWQWLGVIGAGALIGFLEGGAWTDLIFRTVTRLVTGTAPPSYQTVGFQLAAPAVVSSHLGPLSLLNPAQVVIALLEMGPVLLALPLVIWFGIRAFRLGRWYEAATAAAALLSLAMVFVQFTGSTGIRNTPRLYVFMPVCAVFAVPLVWWWASSRSERIKTAAATVGWLAMMGGMVMFGIELMAVQHPVYSYFLTHQDVVMYQEHWNQLTPGSLVFDPEPSRGATVFGRPTNAAYTWYAYKPEWEQLRAAPDPAALRAAGYSYLYLDNRYWDEIGPQFQQSLQSPCVKTIDRLENGANFRHLIDIQNCR